LRFLNPEIPLEGAIIAPDFRVKATPWAEKAFAPKVTIDYTSLWAANPMSRHHPSS
jgi:hypothetical protein